MPKRMRTNSDPVTEDPTVEDRKADFEDWNRQTGEAVARAEGITMTPVHWRVVDFVRAYYSQRGKISAGRELADALNTAFAAQGGSAYLLKQFPLGPVAQASRIGGVPVPPYTEDPSFGSTM